jgi:hypothetical protein
LEAALLEERRVFFRAIGDQDVFQGLALLGDLDLRIAGAPLHLVVVLDEEPVQDRVLGGDLLDQDQAAILVQAIVDPLDHALAIERADELEGEDQHHHGAVFDHRCFVKVALDQLDGAGGAGAFDFRGGFLEHRAGIVDADEGGGWIHHPIKCQQSGGGGDAEVVKIRARGGEVGG